MSRRANIPRHGANHGGGGSDPIHGILGLSDFAIPTVTLGTAAVMGTADTVIRSDATLAAFGTAVPATQAFGDTASAGTASLAARRDHKHAMPATPVTSIAKSGSTALTGAVTLSAGTGVTLTQASNDISIAASGGGGGGYTIGARVYHSANQSIADATVTALAFDSERFDTDTIHDNVTSNSVLTCQTLGKYLVWCTVYFDPNATGYRFVGIYQSAIGGYITSTYTVGNATVGPSMSLATVYAMVVNDYCRVDVKQNSGGALNVRALTAYSTEFGMQRVG